MFAPATCAVQIQFLSKKSVALRKHPYHLEHQILKPRTTPATASAPFDIQDLLGGDPEACTYKSTKSGA